MSKELKYRSVWMGLAIIWVIYYHLPHNFITNPLFLKLQLFGYAGVDIFAYASGIGCYYSLSKNSDTLQFIIRRLKRLLPSYWIFMVVWSIVQILKNHITALSILGNFLGIQYFTFQGIAFNWYIGFLVISYLIAPIAYALIERADKSWKLLLIALLSIIFTLPWIGSASMLILISRLPLFIIGMINGKVEKSQLADKTNSYSLTKYSLCILGIAMLYIVDRYWEGILWDYGVGWYVFILIVPGLCRGVSMLFASAEKNLRKNVSIPLARIGEMSFELFMTHLLMIDIQDYLVAQGLIENLVAYRLVGIVIAFLSAYALKISNDKIMNILKK